MNAQQTPGPWIVRTTATNGCPIVGTHTGFMVAMVASGEGHPADANARVMAAAPTMYQWLTKLFEHDGVLTGVELHEIGVMLDERANAQHTPGPWRVGPAAPNGCPIIGTHAGLMVAMVASGEGADANARVMAAAPTMYQWLTKLLEHDGVLTGVEVHEVGVMLDEIEGVSDYGAGDSEDDTSRPEW